MSRLSSTQRARPLRAARAVAVCGLLAASIAVAGCGSSSSGSSAAASASTDNQQNAARVKLNQCLRQQGVPVPDNAGGGGGAGAQLSDADRQKLQTAVQGPCKQYRSQAFGNITDAQRQAFQDAFVKFSACMRQHGVDVPTPAPNAGGGPPAGGRNRLDQSDPKVKAATTACQSKLPQRPGGRGGPAGGTAQ